MTNINNLITMLTTKKETREGSTLYRGLTNSVSTYYNAINLVTGFKKIRGGNYYSFALCNDDQLTFTTYCEGDVTIEVCDNKEVYDSEFKRYTEFYTENF